MTVPAASPTSSTLTGVVAGSQGLLLTGLLPETNRPLLHISASDRDLEQLRQQLEFFTPDTKTLTFPAWDCLPYDRVSPNALVTAERVETLAQLAHQPTAPLIVLTTANALLQRVPPRALMAQAAFTLAVSQPVDMEALTRFLAMNGYRRTGKVMEPGEYAIRGSIIDLFPPGGELARRIDLFGDDIESIRLLDPLSQRSSDAVDSLLLHPMNEVLLTDANIERFRNGYRRLFGAITREDPLYESIASGRPYPGMEHWLPLFYAQTDTLLDYLPSAMLILDYQLEAVVQDRHENIHDYYDARTTLPAVRGTTPYHPLPPELLYVMEGEWEKVLKKHPPLHCTPFAGSAPTKPLHTLTNLHTLTPPLSLKGEGAVPAPLSARAPSNPLPEGEGGEATGRAGEGVSAKATDFRSRTGRNFAPERKRGENAFEALHPHLHHRQQEGKRTVIACSSSGSRERLMPRLKEHAITCEPVEHWQAIQALPSSATALATFPLEHGFETPDIAILSEQDILGDRILRSVKRRKRPEQFMAEAANFSEGTLVVHREHGIGRFEGLTTVEVNDTRHDCLKLVYDGDDRLFLPVENIDLITRYGSEEMEGAKLDKLGGTHWQARTAKLKERIKMAAEELMKVAADRHVHRAESLVAPPGLYEEFCNRFPFMETEDQERAIADVLGDLASGNPTDRLICGDVGFGKTEVAMRAAFVATTAEGGGVQVAVVTPTTLLARQHYANFVERFAGMPVRIRQLSRLTSAKENTQTLEALTADQVDIVIGTHALLGSRVKFKNLGLMIVDEEQHFGVKQKEKLKQLKHNVHVLTLSATPIPRTLQMALSGIRELSLIATPPVDRLAIRTFVMPYDPVVVREAILREYHRGGQVFYVTPRVKDIPEIRAAINELVPEISIAVAHGQMPPAELDDVMNAFYDGKYQLLLSTSIVESGLDVSSANTLIVNRPDCFGLSQLYQLRGRVGRGKQRAYAYLTLPHHRTLSKNAVKRLEVMQTLDTLGAGFSVASHDMDIRGCGNLLGEEQSGHVREVGVELYQQMLEEAVKKAKHARAPKRAKDGTSVARTSDQVGAQAACRLSAEQLDSEGDDVVEHWSPQINLGLSVLIPETYVEDLELRLGLYRRSAALRNEEEVEDFAAELIDRFGPLPEEVEHLLEVLKVKLLCIKAGIERLDAGPKGIVITFRENRFARPEALIGYISEHAANVKLRADHKLVIARSSAKTNVLKIVQREASALAELAVP